MRWARSPCPRWWGSSVPSVTVAVGTSRTKLRCAVPAYATVGSCRVRPPHQPTEDTTALAQFLPVTLAMVSARKRTVVPALQMLRRRGGLAAALQGALEALQTYLEAESRCPDAAFMVALDIVATGTDRF